MQHSGDVTLNPWRYYNIFLLVAGPWLFMFLVVTPGDTWRDFRFCFDPRIIRRSLRFSVPWKWRLSRPTFSIRSLLIITTLHALQQGFLLQFQGKQWWEMFVLTSLAAIVFVAAAILTSCHVPRRQYRGIYQRTSKSQDSETLPVIEVPCTQTHRLRDSTCRKLQQPLGGERRNSKTGCHMLMGDSAVIFITDSIEAGLASNPSPRSSFGPNGTSLQSPYGLWGAIGTRAGEEVVEEQVSQ